LKVCSRQGDGPPAGLERPQQHGYQVGESCCLSRPEGLQANPPPAALGDAVAQLAQAQDAQRAQLPGQLGRQPAFHSIETARLLGGGGLQLTEQRQVTLAQPRVAQLPAQRALPWHAEPLCIRSLQMFGGELIQPFGVGPFVDGRCGADRGRAILEVQAEQPPARISAPARESPHLVQQEPMGPGRLALVLDRQVLHGRRRGGYALRNGA